MNSTQLGTILNRMFALDGPQRRAFSDQGRRRPPRPLKRSLRRGIVTPVVSRPIQPLMDPTGEDTIVDLKSSGSSLESRPKSYPPTSFTTGSNRKRPRSLYTPERVKRNSVYDRNTSLATTTKTIISA